jgi:redox-sensing transcriptional repressor
MVGDLAKFYPCRNAVEVTFLARVPTIPKPTLERLFLYYRILISLAESGKEVVSSDDMGRRAGVDAAQVRKDLTFCAECGRPGIGYLVGDLAQELEKVLGVKVSTSAVLIGVGRLGSAIENYSGFSRFGLHIEYLFDADPEVIGTKVGRREVRPISEMKEILAGKAIRLGVVAVPAKAAQATADALVEAGVKAIWNFAPVTLRVPPGVIVRNEDLAVGLATLAWYQARAEHL